MSKSGKANKGKWSWITKARKDKQDLVDGLKTERAADAYVFALRGLGRKKGK